LKQRINLYQPALQPVPQRFALPALLRSCSLVLLVIAGITGALQFQLQQQQQQSKKIQTAVQQKSEELANLQKALENRQPEQSLLRQAEQLNAEILQKQQLLQYLTADQQTQPPQYAAVLQQLSAQDLPQFWLRSFRLGKAGVEFDGVTRDAALVPQWLRQLGQSPQFSGQQFSAVSFQPLSQDYLQFRVSSDVTAVTEGTR
jgi:exonuclease VII large subunit